MRNYPFYLLLTLLWLPLGFGAVKADEKTAAADSQPPAAKDAPPPSPPPPEDPNEEKAKKFIIACAEKIEKIDYVSAELHEAAYVTDRTVTSSGIYLRGPDHRTRLELDVNFGDASGKRIQVSDGKVGYQFRKVLDQVDVSSIQLSQVLPLIARKEIPEQARNTIQAQLPLLDPGEMLKGYLHDVTFTSMENKEIGEGDAKRSVTVLEGHWTPQAVDMLAGRQTNGKLENLGGNMPQYLRLFLDDETGWPLRVEMFRKDKKAEFKPVFVLEFRKLKIGEKIPDEQFTFTPPEGVKVTDVTDQWVSNLQGLPDKATAIPSNANPASAVSAPLNAAEPAKEPAKKE
ncbi:MAG: hypothetical protein U1D30_03630 [Planctomycetota bacterium]